jgi:hypothetical protein
MTETFEAYRNRVLSYLGDEDPIAVQQATPFQKERKCLMKKYGIALLALSLATFAFAGPGQQDTAARLQVSDYARNHPMPVLLRRGQLQDNGSKG